MNMTLASFETYMNSIFDLPNAHTVLAQTIFAYCTLGVGIAGYFTIRYNRDSAILDIFLENPIMIHHDICLNRTPVKRLSASFLFLFMSKPLENSKKNYVNQF